MINYASDKDNRDRLFYDPAVKGSDTNFWKGDSAQIAANTAGTALVLGDTVAGVGMSSYSQYLYGDFEFTVTTDSTTPDTDDSDKRWGLINRGDTLERGAAYFRIIGDSDGEGLSSRVVSDTGGVVSKSITFDTLWVGVPTRYRILWETDGYTFLINDTVVATMGDRDTGQLSQPTTQIGTSIPQALRLVNRTGVVTDTTTLVSFVLVRHSRNTKSTNVLPYA